MHEKIIEKISRYNLFNYLLPGILFIVFAPRFYGQNLIIFFNQNLIVSLFLSYFIGMIISRLGSMIIELILKKIKFVSFSKHSDFLEASKLDDKIEVLSEENNVYRTLVSLFFILLFLYWLIPFIQEKQLAFNHLYLIIFILCLVLFIFSYRKQVNYINSRINKVLNK